MQYLSFHFIVISNVFHLLKYIILFFMAFVYHKKKGKNIFSRLLDPTVRKLKAYHTVTVYQQTSNILLFCKGNVGWEYNISTLSLTLKHLLDQHSLGSSWRLLHSLLRHSALEQWTTV